MKPHVISSLGILTLLACGPTNDHGGSLPPGVIAAASGVASAPVQYESPEAPSPPGSGLSLQPLAVGRLEDFVRYRDGIEKVRNGRRTLGTSVAIQRVGDDRHGTYIVGAFADPPDPTDNETTLLLMKAPGKGFAEWDEFPARVRVRGQKRIRRAVAGRHYGTFYAELALADENGDGPFDASWADYYEVGGNWVPTTVLDVAYLWSDKRRNTIAIVTEASGRLSASQNLPAEVREIRGADEASCPATSKKFLDVAVIDSTFFAARYDCVQSDQLVLERFDEGAATGVVVGAFIRSGMDAPLPKPWLESDAGGLVVLVETPEGSKAFRVDPQAPSKAAELPFPRARGILAFQMAPDGALAVAARYIEEAPAECTMAKDLVVATRDKEGAWHCLALLASESPQLRGLVQAHDGAVYVAVMDDDYATLYSTAEDQSLKFKPPRAGSQ